MAIIDWLRGLISTNAIIRHEGSKWNLYSHKGKKLGSFDSKEDAKKREREIQFFKNK